MDAQLEQRLSSVIAKRHMDTLALDLKDADPSRQRQIAHNRLTAELHRLSAKVTAAVAELNDRMCDTDIWLNVEHLDHTLTSVKVFVISLVSVVETGPTLVLTVDWTGNLRGMLKSHESRTLLHSFSVFSVTTTDITEMLVTLMESHYH
jgi:hypothetical protein